ncbi:exodeoxyribonuclease VII, large subunit [mine drainage metagenome]|uniref:Exodeoxyribonuclease VII, large subunit n=3 Tax=mine drainage metagenome TaxID=410659 RepID=T0YDX5_9ZZZZ
MKTLIDWPDNPPERMPGGEPISVAELIQRVQHALADSFGPVLVAGEIADLRRPASGHCYFNLKDATSSLRAVLFEREARKLAFSPENGLQVIALGRVGLYAARGDFQLIVEYLEEAGEGSLRREYERLKKLLQAQGLFDTRLKRPLPPWPRRIGIVSSGTGAAVRDVLTVLARRMPLIPVRIAPAQVQGEGAEGTLIEALARLNQDETVDVVILTRGGGSLKDFAPFNTAALVRAIRASRVPVVTGIGHEIDETLADLAADLNGITPSGAAERVAPARVEIESRLADWRERLVRQHPKHRLDELGQRLDELAIRNRQTIEGIFRECVQRVRILRAHLATQGPANRLHLIQRELSHWGERLRIQIPSSRITSGTASLAEDRNQLLFHIRIGLDRACTRLDRVRDLLHARDPKLPIRRGFALVRDRSGRIVGAARNLHPQDALTLEWSDGRVGARVEWTDSLKDPDAPE